MPSVRLGSRRISLPGNRIARVALGGALCVLGVFGFLPILGFWMVPLGLIILSYDFAAVRRFRRRVQVKFQRWWNARRAASAEREG